MASTIRVNILDREYALRVNSEEDVQLTADIATYVDERLRAFLKNHPERPEMTAAVITALTITEELFEARAALRRQQEETELRLTDLEDVLDRALAR
jgi:cell division protein ZapA (FtsZ GTPase activity inhibitor)